MTVIKRNGSEVTFDITKIIAAITKANESVDESIRMTPMPVSYADPADRGKRGVLLPEDEPFPLCGGNTRFSGVSDHGPRRL